MTAKVLVVEDDEAMAVALHDGFASEGDHVLRARDGARGLELAASHAVDIVLLDVMLPKLSGLDLCRRLRRDGSNVPIIMLTARGQELDKVVGLRAGADDYVTKPFGFLALLARVRAVRRRAQRPAVPDTATFAARLLEEDGVALAAGEHFGLPGWTRIGLGTEEGKLREGLRRLSQALDDVR